MKKLIALLLALTMIFAFAACAKAPAAEGEKTSAKATAKVIEIPLTSEDYGFAVNKEDTELLGQVNDYLAKIEADGSLKAIIDKYMNEEEDKYVPVESAKLDKSKDQLVIDTSPDFPPFEFTQGNMYIGIDIEIIKGFADSIGKELVVNPYDFNGILSDIEAGNADMGVSGFTKNPAREKQVTFSTTYHSVPQYIIVKSDDTTFDSCKTKEDVEKILNGFGKDVIIGGQNGTTGIEYVIGNADFGFDGFNATSKGYDAGAQAVQDLINGNINYVIIDGPTALAIVSNANKMA